MNTYNHARPRHTIPTSGMNPWEAVAYEQYKNGRDMADAGNGTQTHDPLIYPGLYSASGFDMLGILVEIMNRKDKKVDLGPIDTSCALIVCDLKQPDQPIVYASPAFLHMTGYKSSEVIGRNCRFLQAPGGKVKPKSPRKYVDKEIIKKMRKAVDKNQELQIEVVNFRKTGEKFTNLLSIIPVRFGSHDYNYSVGFQCEKED
ncbi:PAS domain-containing protein [Diplogelasinospora grovesii]|uniref:PAS domain-containing protein n=1 Tax=Diplogelasinospora grovesii TaxID=303347 RepID=A0AAN6N9G5_9PEZI|nr:PAS domain-containing protein [Diplogelasinospora grovesii]